MEKSKFVALVAQIERITRVANHPCPEWAVAVEAGALGMLDRLEDAVKAAEGGHRLKYSLLREYFQNPVYGF